MFIFHLMYHIKNIEATRQRYMKTRPMLHEAETEAEAEAKTYEAEDEAARPQNLASRPYWPQGLNIPG